jgi:anti-sigma-K factor RskA
LLDQLAGAYVLGTLSRRARRRLASVAERSPAVQRALAQWHERLAPLERSIPQVTPGAHVWQRIAQRTQPVPAPAAWWQRLRRPGWSAPALAFSLGIVLTLGVLHQAPQTLGLAPIATRSAPSYVGLLTDASGEPVLGASSLRRGTVLTVKLLKPLSIPAGKVAMLWALPADGAPVPVGAVPGSGKVEIALGAPSDTVFATVARLAVSFEDSAGAATPAGAFVISGHCIKLW